MPDSQLRNHWNIHTFFEWVWHRMLLGDTVTIVCASPRNSTWFTKLFLLVRGWGLGTRLWLVSAVHQTLPFLARVGLAIDDILSQFFCTATAFNSFSLSACLDCFWNQRHVHVQCSELLPFHLLPFCLLLYSRKISSLADWPKPAWTKILANFNLADDQARPRHASLVHTL